MTTIEPDPSALVASFSEASARVDAMFRLQALGADALPAIREGLQHPDWHVRHCVRKMAAAMLFLQPLDPRAKPALEAALARETDPRMRLHTERALSRYRGYH